MCVDDRSTDAHPLTDIWHRQSNLSRLNKGPPRKFSTFLKSMVVEFDRDPTLYPESNIVEVRGLDMTHTVRP